jgi:hypothetical protein
MGSRHSTPAKSFHIVRNVHDNVLESRRKSVAEAWSVDEEPPVYDVLKSVEDVLTFADGVFLNLVRGTLFLERIKIIQKHVDVLLTSLYTRKDLRMSRHQQTFQFLCRYINKQRSSNTKKTRTSVDSQYLLLTSAMEKTCFTDDSYRQLNALRSYIVDAARDCINSILSNRATVTTDNGSDSRGSDMDISTAGDTASATLCMVYFLGCISRRLYPSLGDIPCLGDIPSVVGTMHHGLNHLQTLLDIEIYSSSGVFHGTPTGQEADTARYMTHIHDNVYHLIRKHDCMPQMRFYRILVAYLLSRIYYTKNGVEYLKDTTSTQQGVKFVRQLRLHTTLCDQAQTLTQISKLSRLERFKIQLAYSHDANITAGHLMNSLTGEQRCEWACRWERMQSIANVASPESTVAPATYVDVVYRTQKKMKHYVHLDSTEQYLSFIENLGFLCSHFKHIGNGKGIKRDGVISHLADHGHLRKAYKYAIRTVNAFGMISGDPHAMSNFRLDESRGEQLRHPETLDDTELIAEICVVLETVQNVMVDNALICAPHSIRVLLTPVVRLKRSMRVVG